MTGEPLFKLCSILANMPSGKENAWTDKNNEPLTMIYTFGLADLPDDAFAPVSKAIIMRCQWRPTVAEIREIWKSISGAEPPMLATDALAQVLDMMRRYGPNASPHPNWPNNPNIRSEGPPPQLAGMPDALQRTVRGFGGWVAMCNDDSPSGVFRGQFERMYNAVVAGEGDGDIRRLRLEYQVAHPAPQLEDSSADDFADDEGDVRDRTAELAPMFTKFAERLGRKL